MPEAEPTPSTPGVNCWRPGVRSYSEWLGAMHSENAPLVRRTMGSGSAAAISGSNSIDFISDAAAAEDWLAALEEDDDNDDERDGNDDGQLNIADAIKILGHLFGGDGDLAAPTALDTAAGDFWPGERRGGDPPAGLGVARLA